MAVATFLKLTNRSAGRSVALGFVTSFAIASVSGLFYWLIPWHWNWHASQLALVIHLALGLLCLLQWLPYSLIHLRDKDPAWASSLWRWPLLGKQQHGRFLQIAYGSFWLTLLLLLSGLLLSWPALLWLAQGTAWLWPLGVTELIRWLHLGLFFVAAAALLAHLPRDREKHQ